MKILGIIAEYNPFHNGHLYHIKKSKEITGADAVIAVMSGNFVQRGEPAIVDKWARAEMAVRNGVDLVLELPFAYAVNSADMFAKGGVKLLDSLGCVDCLSFGSESGNLDELKIFADALGKETEEFKVAFRKGIASGESYPLARTHALMKRMGADFEVLKKPNNSLAIEYLRYLNLLDSDIAPVTIRREGQGYNDSNLDAGNDNDYGRFASATAIRTEMLKNAEISTFESVLSKDTIDVFKKIDNDVKLKLNDFYDKIVYEILKSTPEELAEILAVREGLENRMKAAVRTSCNIDELINEIVSKRYTFTRIRRILIQTLLGLKRSDFEMIDDAGAMYARILAFSEKGASIIKSIKKSERCSIPVITNINKDWVEGEAMNKLLEYDLKASDIYNFVCGRSIYEYSDNVRTPFMLK